MEGNTSLLAFARNLNDSIDEVMTELGYGEFVSMRQYGTGDRLVEGRIRTRCSKGSGKDSNGRHGRSGKADESLWLEGK
jgi:hypothetical protein